MAAEPRRRPPPVGFQPRFTLMLLYFAALVFVYCFALAAPIVYRYFEIGSSGGAGPEQQAQLAEAMREALRGRLWIAGLAAAATMALGIWARVLPGLRPPR
jgi:ABC-type sulfate transport system permease component